MSALKSALRRFTSPEGIFLELLGFGFGIVLTVFFDAFTNLTLGEAAASGVGFGSIAMALAYWFVVLPRRALKASDDPKQRLKRLIRKLAVEGDEFAIGNEETDPPLKTRRHIWRMRAYDLSKAALGEKAAAGILADVGFPFALLAFRQLLDEVDQATLLPDFDPSEWEAEGDNI